MELKSKIAIVTGASSGLGEAIAQALIHEGVKVYGLARSADKLQAIQEKLGKQFIPVVMDVTDLEGIQSWIKSTFEHTPPDILINNAGIGGFAKIDAMPIEQWTGIIDTNLKGMYYMTTGIIPLMKQHPNSSHIVNIGSIIGTTTKGEATAYAASKFAVNGFSEALFKEVRSDNIKVTCVNPGSIETDFFVHSGIEGNNKMLKPKEVADTIIFILKTPDNVLIDSIMMRPLRP